MEGAGSWEWERRPQTEIRILGGYAVLISDDDIAVVSPQPGTPTAAYAYVPSTNFRFLCF